MAKKSGLPKKATPKKGAKPAIVKKMLGMPADWWERIDARRGDSSVSEFIRAAVLDKIGQDGLSVMPAWGQGRPKK